MVELRICGRCPFRAVVLASQNVSDDVRDSLLRLMPELSVLFRVPVAE